jgi:hypothetical protein
MRHPFAITGLRQVMYTVGFKIAVTAIGNFRCNLPDKFGDFRCPGIHGANVMKDSPLINHKEFKSKKFGKLHYDNIW